VTSEPTAHLWRFKINAVIRQQGSSGSFVEVHKIVGISHAIGKARHSYSLEIYNFKRKVTKPQISQPTRIKIPRCPKCFKGEKRQDMSITKESKEAFCLFSKADIVLWKRFVSEQNYVP
jgi:hypothetical protein